ncbi:MAG: alkaline phosphatase [Chthoniobacterales bacterium]|nr:alkaline phosphatase [Chthoniobacterales bacterium]
MTMKIRNRLIALSCFLLFVAIGATYFWKSGSQQPFAIILFVGDGMSPSTLTATRLYDGGADDRLALEEFPNLALTRTYGNDFAVPDTASAATTLATGERVNHQSLAIDVNGKPLLSLLEEAASNNRAVGLLSTGSLTGESAAAFYAKSLSPQDQTATAAQLLAHTPIDLLIGGGKKYFSSPHAEKKNPEPSLLEQLSTKGYSVVKNNDEWNALPSWKSSPILALLAEDDFAFHDPSKGESAQPSLADLVKQSIQRLQHSRHGYLLIVDDALIAKAAATNKGEQLFHEILQFDQAIAMAKQYAGPNALIVVTGKQNLGGLRMNGTPFRNDKGVAVLGVNAQGAPSLTWSSGPGHNVSSDGNKENSSILAEPSSFNTPAALGIATDTITLGMGPGSEQIHGFIDLTTVHDVIKKEL